MNDRITELAALGGVGGWFRRRGKSMHVEVGKPCANCGAVLQGPWCFNCGQSAEEMHRSVFKLLAEALEGLFHADGRLWKTLPDLMLRPARLTRAYLDGKRVPQVPPFNLFLIILVVVFFTGHLATSHEKHAQANAASAAAANGDPAKMTKDQRRQARAGFYQARAALAQNVGPQAVAAFDAKMRPLLDRFDAADRADRARRQAKARAADSDADSDEVSDSDVASSETRVSDAIATRHATPAPTAHPAPAAPSAPGSPPGTTRLTVGGAPVVSSSMDDNITILNGRYKSLNDWAKVRYEAIKANPKQFELVLEGWAHRIAILTLPVSAMMLTFLFAFNRKFYVFDHLVFSMHSLSFQLLLLSGGFLLSMGIGSAAWWLAWLCPVHLYRHMRGVYKRGRFMTLLTMFVLFIGTTISFSLLAMVWIAFAFNDMGGG